MNISKFIVHLNVLRAALLFILLSVSSAHANGFVGGISFPSLDDEKTLYLSQGWASATDDLCQTSCNQGFGTLWGSAQPSYAMSEAILDAIGGIHDGTEGDDLWLYLMQYRRTGQTGFKDRAVVWAAYMKDEYLADAQDSSEVGFNYDHAYANGLISYFEHTGDTAYRTAAFAVCNAIKALYENGGVYEFVTPGVDAGLGAGGGRMGEALRGQGRHLLSIARCYEYDNATYETVFYKLIDLYTQAPDFASAGPSGGGNYFFSQSTTDSVCGAGQFAAGVRVEEGVHQGISIEALFHTFRVLQDTTRKDAIKAKIIAIGRWTRDFGLNASNQMGHYYGANINTAVRVGCGGMPSSGDYKIIAVTNSMVFASWFLPAGAEKTALYNRAVDHLKFGTHIRVGAAPLNEVDHFLDVVTDGTSGIDGKVMGYNKGELQYAWAVFHAINRNTTIGQAALALQVGEVAAITVSNSAVLNDTSPSKQILTFANTAEFDPGFHRINFCGSAHLATVLGAHCVTIDENAAASYLDFAPTWRVEDTQHQYDHCATDSIRRKFYCTPRGGANLMDLYECDITAIANCDDGWTKRVDLSGYSISDIGVEFVSWRDSFLMNGVAGCTGSKCADLIEIPRTTFTPSTSSRVMEIPGAIEASDGYPHQAYILNQPLTAIGVTGREFYTFDKAGTLTQRANLPAGCTGYVQNVLPVVDPVTGDFLIIGCDDYKVYKFSLQSPSWSEVTFATAPGWFTPAGTPGFWADLAVAVPISTYGVIGILRCPGNPTDCTLFLYKHAEMLEAVPGEAGSAPTAPTSLVVRQA